MGSTAAKCPNGYGAVLCEIEKSIVDDFGRGTALCSWATNCSHFPLFHPGVTRRSGHLRVVVGVGACRNADSFFVLQTRDTLRPDRPVSSNADFSCFTACLKVKESRGIVQELEAAARRTCWHYTLANSFFQFIFTFIIVTTAPFANALVYILKLLKLVFGD